MSRPTTRIHIGRKKAYPAHCPDCGIPSSIRDINSLSDVIRAHFSDPNRVVARSIPGWPGAITWWYECQHEDPLSIELMRRYHVFASISEYSSGRDIPFYFRGKL